VSKVSYTLTPELGHRLRSVGPCSRYDGHGFSLILRILRVSHHGGLPLSLGLILPFDRFAVLAGVAARMIVFLAS
jgi:hypothetical protein